MQIGFPVPPFSPTYSDPCFCRSGEVFGKCCGSGAAERGFPAGIQRFENFVDPATCRKWVARLERQPRERARVVDVNETSGASLTPRAKAGRVCDDVKPGVLRQKINDQVRRGFELAAGTTGHAVEWFESPRVLRYQAGGFYHAHSDSCQIVKAANSWFKVLDRDLSLLLYLNEEYAGGGLTFLHFNFHYRPRVGDMLVFPSDNRYEHRAEQVTSGLRYAVASWAALRGTRRVLPVPPRSAIPVPPAGKH